MIRLHLGLVEEKSYGSCLFACNQIERSCENRLRSAN